MTLAERLRTRRIELNLTLRDVRERVEQRTGHVLAYSYFNNLERGKKTNPGIETLAAIAAGLDWTLIELLSRVDS